jgi:hypothetical protein
MNEVKVGDIVKSFDFPGNEECFMVGKVVSVSKQFSDFRAEFIKRVWMGELDKSFKTDFFTAPVQGSYYMDDKFQRIVVVA